LQIAKKGRMGTENGSLILITAAKGDMLFAQ